MKSLFLVLTLSVFSKCVYCTSEEETRQWSYFPQTPGANPRDSYLNAAEHSNSIKGGGDQGGGIAAAADTSQYYNNYYPPADPGAAYYYQIHPNKPKYYGYGNNIASKQSFSSNFVDAVENTLDGNFLERPDEASPKQTEALTLAGIASLVTTAISGLSWFAIAGLILVLGPIVVPLVLAPLIFIGLVIYFIPVIQLNIPADSGRSLIANRAINAINSVEGTARFVQFVAENEECIERVSCEIARMARGNLFENWINKKLESFKNKWVSRVSRSFKVAVSGSDCKVFTCNPAVQFRRVAQSFGART